MQFKEALNKLKKDKTFQAWEEENPQHYLAHGFFMKDKQVREAWQIGFYNKAEDRISTFTVDEIVTENPPSALFKKESGVQELLEADVIIELDEALEAAEQHRLKHFKGHEPLKTIILLQKLKQGQLWNITFFTNTFSVCNVKIDSKTKEILSSSCESVLGWAKKDS